MKKILRFLSYCLFALVFILALLLAAVPSVIVHVASSQYAERVAEGELKIDAIDINYFTGNVKLKGVQAQKAQQQVLSLGEFTLDIAVLDLLDGLIVVEDINLSDFSIEVDQSQQRIIVAGYEQPLETLKHEAEVVEQAVEKVNKEPWLKGVRLQRLALNNVKVHFINADVNAHATVDSLRVENFDTLKPEQQTLVDLALSIGGVELHQQGKKLLLPAGAKVAVQAKLSQLLAEPKILANLSLEQVVVQAAEISTQLVAFEHLQLRTINYSANNLKVDELKLTGLQGVTADGANKALFGFQELLVQGIQLPELKSLGIDSVQLSALHADVVLGKQRQLKKLQPVLDYFSTAAAPSQLVKAEKATAQAGFPVSVARVAVDGEIYFKDQGVSPAFERTVKLSSLEFVNINTADTETYTDLLVKASLGAYSQIDLGGQLQFLAKDPSGFLKGSVTGVELVALSPYAVEATGYFIRTGTAKANIDVSLKKAELGGEVGVVLNAIKLAPGDQQKMEQLKTSLSMPLDVALGLLRDKKGDVNIKLPMQGNINSPDFKLGDVMGQVSKKVLKKATIVGLKYAFQPYGAMITVGSWLGKKATAVRLDPLLYQHGETAINEEQKQYLAKVGEIMGSKEDLRIKLCSQASPAELQALQAQAQLEDPQAQAITQQQLLSMATQRAELVRDHLVEEFAVDAARLLLCQPSYDEKSKAKQSLVHLEI